MKKIESLGLVDSGEKLLRHLAAWKPWSVLVVGDYMLDQTVHGAAERISPDAPVPVFAIDGRTPSVDTPGGSGNVGIFSRALEGAVHCVGVTGADAEGRLLKKVLHDAGCDISGLVEDPSRPTTVKRSLVGLAQHRHPQKMFRIDIEDRAPISRATEDALLDAKARGHIKHIGFTCHSLSTALTLADEDVFETVQFPFNLVTHEPADELIPKVRANHLGFIVMKPMCGGQFDDAQLAFKFLNSYPDLVAIPGIETAAEIEEIVSVVDSGATLTGDEAARAEEIVQRLGKVFCRRCGYCEPCPQGVPIGTSVLFEGLARRFPNDLGVQIGKGIVEGVPKCTECGQCVDKCPYDLPIPDLIKTGTTAAQAFLEDNA